MNTTTKLIIGVVALGALALGAYYQANDHNSHKHNDPIDLSVDDMSESSDIIQNFLLSARLISADGPTIVGDKLGKLTLINFWATWCAPCRHEMPIFEAMYRQNKAPDAEQTSFQIIGIAIDSQDKAQPFLDSMDITYPILYAEKTGYELMESTGNPQGLLPYSILLDENGKALEQVLGRINEQQITDWLEKYL